jgi:hypothetical protein
MNAKRRKELEKVTELIEQAKCTLELMKEEEQEAFDNLPESFQSGEKGERMEEVINYLDDAFGELEAAIDNINSAIE